MTGTERTGGTAHEAFQIVSLADRPELARPVLELLAVGWPEFMQHDPATQRHQGRVATELARFQILLLDRDKDELAAAGVSIPFAWDQARQRAALRLGRRRRAGHRRPGRRPGRWTPRPADDSPVTGR